MECSSGTNPIRMDAHLKSTRVQVLLCMVDGQSDGEMGVCVDTRMCFSIYMCIYVHTYTDALCEEALHFK